MLRTILWLLISLSLAGGLFAAEEKAGGSKTQDGAALMRAHQESILWMTRVKSLHLKAIAKEEKTLPGLLKNQRDVQRQFNPGKNPDPLDFKQLLPEFEFEYECDFDQNRFHQTTNFLAPQKTLTDRHVRFWDGKRGVVYSRDLYRKEEFHEFSASPKEAGSSMLSIGLEYTKPVWNKFWWHDTPENQKNYELQFGKPEDFVYVGRDEYHGVDCHVLLSSRGNQTDRYYFRRQDGRWIGAEEGIVASRDPIASMRDYRLALEELLGRKLDHLDLKSPEYQAILKSVRSLSQEDKERWCRIEFSHVKKYYPPLIEYWFDDYRDLGNGRILPFVQTTLNYTAEKNAEGKDEIFLNYTRTLTVEEIAIDQPIPDGLFEAPPIKEGAKIFDRVHKPPLFYDYKEHFTPEEWELIVRKGKQREEQEAKRKPQKDQILVAPAQKK